MGLGYALTEDFVVEGGHITTDTINRSACCAPTRCPSWNSSSSKKPDPECPYGARGVGEIGLVPTAPGIAGAL